MTDGSRAGAGRALLATLVLLVTLVTFLPVIDHALLNWDDPEVLLRNPHLQGADVAWWAFTTRYMEHYQPVSWLAWAGLAAWTRFGAGILHASNLTLHLVNTALVFAVFVRISLHGSPQPDRATSTIGALVAALAFAIHPLRVEVVAWASALPYALAAMAMLASVLAYLRACGPEAPCTDRIDIRWLALSVLYFALSLLARPVALGYPLVLLVLDAWPLRRRLSRGVLLEKIPFVLLALGGGAMEWWAREPGAADLPISITFQNAVAAPFIYLWRTLVPVGLTPLDVWPSTPRADGTRIVAAIAAILAITAALWRVRRQWPAPLAAWLAYLALLAPAAGLVASGQQVTADRYSYLPGVALAMAGGAAFARLCVRERSLAGGSAIGATRSQLAALSTQASPAVVPRWAVLGVAAALAVSSALATRAYLRHWTDSISLWTRVLAIQPANDVALYNLGEALAAAGRRDEAIEHYRQLLALRPDHAAGRKNLDLLEAIRFELEGNALAGHGNLRGAAEAYAEAIARDPRRTHSHAARGMALLALGDSDAAVPSLQEAVRQGVDDPAVANALALVLGRRGDARQAREVLVAALARHPDSMELAHNLARLLALADDPEVRDPATALRLATAVAQSAGEDPRALDTLAAAYAVNGRAADARDALSRAELAARHRGDRELADAIAARRRSYARTHRTP